MSVRPPGYYTSWFHVVADIETTSDIDLYKWIGNYTDRVYGYRWTNASKKLNAILTIQPGTVISASDLAPLINNLPAASSCVPAILIDSRFRPYDRITIINKGKIIGAYGQKNYKGSDTFTPPAQVASSVENGSIIITHDVTVATLTVAAGGGKGGKAADKSMGLCGGAGGGGSGGIKTSTESVTPGSEVTASGGLAGQDAKYTQGLMSVEATKGGDGGDSIAAEPKSREACPAINLFDIFCQTIYQPYTAGKGGAKGRPDGSPGSDGSARDQEAQSRDCNLCIGGAGGSAGGGAGGRGRDGCDSRARIEGGKGYTNYSYNRKELFGPAIVVRHTNVRIINDEGIIAGGYSNPSIYALYGSGNVENKIGGIIVPSSPGITTNNI